MSKFLPNFEAVNVDSAIELIVPEEAWFVNVLGTTDIESITPIHSCHPVIFGFADVLTVVDGENLALAGGFVTALGSTLMLVCFDRTNWAEVSRSSN